MSLNLDKSSWKRVAFRDVVRHITDRVDAETSGLERFLAGEHIPRASLAITSWGVIGKDPIGPMFYKRFEPGHVLYVSRRTYLRKVAVPDFEGVTGEKTFVLQTIDPSVLLQEFLPFVLSAERFHAYAVANSRGSVNPYLNWGELARYEFALPPLDEQKRIADLLWAAERDSQALVVRVDAIKDLRAAHLRECMSEIARTAGTVELDTLISPGRPITYGILMPGTGHPGGVPVVKVKDFPDGHIREQDLLLTSPELAHEYRRSTLKPGDLLISIRGTVGRLAEVPTSLDGANITQDTARLSIAPEHDRQYVRLVLESEFAQRQVERQITGLAVKGLNLGALKKLQIPVPQAGGAELTLVRESAQIDEAISQARACLRSCRVVRSSLIADAFGGN